MIEHAENKQNGIMYINKQGGDTKHRTTLIYLYNNQTRLDWKVTIDIAKSIF